MNKFIITAGLKTLRKSNLFAFSRFKQEPPVKYEEILELEEHKTELYDASYLIEARRNEKGEYIIPKEYSDDEYLKMMGKLSRYQHPK